MSRIFYKKRVFGFYTVSEKTLELIFLRHKEEFDEEQRRDDVGDNRYILRFAREDFDDRIGDEADTDGMADGAGDRHGDQHERDRNKLVDFSKVDVLQTGEHQDADIDEGG